MTKDRLRANRDRYRTTDPGLRKVNGMRTQADARLGVLYDGNSEDPIKILELVKALRGARPQPMGACLLMALALKTGEPRLIDDANEVIEHLNGEPLVPWLLSQCSKTYSEVGWYHQAAASAIAMQPRGNWDISHVKGRALCAAAEGLSRGGFVVDAQAVIEAIDVSQTESYNRWLNGRMNNGSLGELPAIETLSAFAPAGAPLPAEFSERIKPGLPFRPVASVPPQIMPKV